MKTPVVLVATALTIAILLAASLLIATGTRSEKAGAVLGAQRPAHYPNPSFAKLADPAPSAIDII